MNTELRKAIYKRICCLINIKNIKEKQNGKITENKGIMLKNEGNNQLNYISLKGAVGANVKGLLAYH